MTYTEEALVILKKQKAIIGVANFIKIAFQVNERVERCDAHARYLMSGARQRSSETIARAIQALESDGYLERVDVRTWKRVEDPKPKKPIAERLEIPEVPQQPGTFNHRLEQLERDT